MVLKRITVGDRDDLLGEDASSKVKDIGSVEFLLYYSRVGQNKIIRIQKSGQDGCMGKCEHIPLDAFLQRKITSCDFSPQGFVVIVDEYLQKNGLYLAKLSYLGYSEDHDETDTKLEGTLYEQQQVPALKTT